MSAPASFATFVTSGGVKIQRIPLEALPGFWAYAYLVCSAENNYLIDCGSGTDPSHDGLMDGLGKAGLQPSDLTHILLTHAHIDHYGGLARLKPITRAKIGCHELDVQTVVHHEARLALTSHRLASFLADSGLAKEEIESLLSIYGFTKALYQSVPLDFTYDKLNDHLPALEVIHLPGHCPGHVALRLDDVIFCGDMVVEGVTPHLTPESITLYGGLDRYLNSLQRFQEWANGSRLILNGHDDVITDLKAQVEATHKNILRRMGRAVKALSEPLTVAEICRAVYGEMTGYQLLLVIEKTGAYVEYFYEHAMIEITNPAEVQQGLPAKYRRSREIADDEILPPQRTSVIE